jgi:capsular exopolysaccharide synthesis family protein
LDNGGEGQAGEWLPAAHSGQRDTLVMRRDELLQGAYEIDDDTIDPWDYVNIVLRRRWTVAATFAVSVLATLIFSLAATPKYRSTILLQIQPTGPHVTNFDAVQEAAAPSQSYNDFFQTQYDLLLSRGLAIRTINALSLERNAFINGDAKRRSRIGRAFGFIGRLTGGGSSDPERLEHEREQLVVENFIDGITVEPRRKSFLVELGFLSPDPELSQKVAGEMGRQYIELVLDQSVAAATQARGFIEKQLAKVKGSLEQSESELQAFARGHDIHAVEQEERVINERLGDLNMLLTEAEGERIERLALFQQATGEEPRSIEQVVNNGLIRSLREELARGLAERAELGALFTAEYPIVRALDARIALLEVEIESEIQRIIAGIRGEYEQAVARENLFEMQLRFQKDVVANYEQKSVAFKIHQREVQTNRAIYEDLLRRMKEVEVNEAIRASNVVLVDRPVLPLEPHSPNIPLNMALSVLLGLVGSVGFAFAQEYMDDSLKTPDDVERYLHLPTLGTIPEFSKPESGDADDGLQADLQVAYQPTSAGSEAIRTLRASLFLAAPGGFPTRLLLTSARPGEGKTCITINLGIALAQMGRRVCLIDCDLRRPRVNKALAIDLGPGLTNYLTGNQQVDEIIRPSGHRGLDIITAGPIPPNPVDLLDSANMTRLLGELDQRYDHVLVDAPPALGFADVPIMTNQLGGGCLLVTRSGETSRRLAKQACDYLIRMQSKLLGVVLNRVSTRRAGYSYYGYYGYYGDHYSPNTDEVLESPESNAA